MEYVELVIKIPKEKYNAIKIYRTFPAEMKAWGLEAIRNGTPLQGHDRLIEAKRLKEVFRRNTGHDYHDLIDNAPTIIEADEESEGRNETDN